MRINALIFTFLYFISSVGYGVEVHYCLGMVSDVSYIWFDASCACDDSGSETHAQTKSCCDEDSFFNQIDDEHQGSVSLVVKSPLVIPEQALMFEGSSEIEKAENSLELDRGPPPIIDRVIAFHRLILYG